MRAFASYILRGRLQAIIVAISTAVMSMLLPPLSHVSGATIGLVTLRHGLAEGLIVIAGATAVIWLLGMLSSLDSLLIQVFLGTVLLVAWLPVAICATVLRKHRDLGRALMVAGLFALLALTLLYTIIGDVTAWWSQILSAVFAPMLDNSQSGLAEADLANVVDGLAGIMSGLMAAAIVISIMINLFLARWWQAMLFNPGGFRQEFNAIRMDRVMVVIALLIVVLGGLMKGVLGDFGRDLMFLIMAMFSIQGLALVHAVIAAKKAHRAWLIGLYILMLFILPQVIMVLAAAGLTDSWLDFRRRFGLSGKA